MNLFVTLVVSSASRSVDAKILCYCDLRLKLNTSISPLLPPKKYDVKYVSNTRPNIYYK